MPPGDQAEFAHLPGDLQSGPIIADRSLTCTHPIAETDGGTGDYRMPGRVMVRKAV
jgi:hypothetical protein